MEGLNKGLWNYGEMWASTQGGGSCEEGGENAKHLEPGACPEIQNDQTQMKASQFATGRTASHFRR